MTTQQVPQLWHGIMTADLEVLRRVLPGQACFFSTGDGGDYEPSPDDVTHVSTDGALSAIVHPGHADSLDALCREAVSAGEPRTCRLAIPREVRMRSLLVTAVPVWSDDHHGWIGALCRGEEVRAAVAPVDRARFTDDEFERALEHGEFLVHYQPIHELRTGLLVGAEALLRWDHPEHGLIAPLDFIPQAEESGHIIDIGRWVMMEACHQAVGWAEMCPRRLGISVNVSPVQMENGSIVQAVRAALSSSGLDPAVLTLELTETTLAASRNALQSVVGHLRSIGVQIAIDDFGVGYSNLARMKELRGRIVKIDRSLVTGVDSDHEARELLGSVITFAKSLDCITVAEGVETNEELDELRLLGIDYSQGFHHARPMPGDEFDAYVEADLERPLH